MSGLLGRDSQLRQTLGYRKLNTDSIHVLLLDGQYHLCAEVTRALRRLGHRVSSVSVPPDAVAKDVMRTLLWGLVEHKPDMVLSVNYIGFDAEGQIGALLDELEMPVAVWCVDNPLFVIPPGPAPAPKMTSLFLWERSWLDAMRARGLDDIHHLPLATDPHVFSPRAHARRTEAPAPATPASPRQQPERASLAFVGDSMQRAIDAWQRRLSAADWDRARALAARLTRGVNAVSDRVDIWAAATQLATRAYRHELLARLAETGLRVFGDVGWRSCLPAARYCGPVRYGPDLAAIYATTDINLNATSLQMPCATNQRVFDVPACGGFVLSDAQADMERFFVLGKEAIVYASPDELDDLVHYYRAHPSARRRIAEHARARVLREHTYAQRVQSLVDTVRRRHRRMGFGSPVRNHAPWGEHGPD